MALMDEIQYNRPDVATGERMMMGSRIQTYPTHAVVEATVSTDRTGMEWITITAPGGGKATMSRESFHGTCYPADYETR